MAKAMFGNGEEREKAKEECGELLQILDSELKDKKFFVGDKIGFVDIAANVLAFWMGIMEEASGIILVKNETFPNYYAWRDNYINCNQVKEYLPSRDELFAHFQSRFHSVSAPK